MNLTKSSKSGNLLDQYYRSSNSNDTRRSSTKKKTNSGEDPPDNPKAQSKIISDILKGIEENTFIFRIKKKYKKCIPLINSLESCWHCLFGLKKVHNPLQMYRKVLIMIVMLLMLLVCMYYTLYNGAIMYTNGFVDMSKPINITDDNGTVVGEGYQESYLLLTTTVVLGLLLLIIVVGIIVVYFVNKAQKIVGLIMLPMILLYVLYYCVSVDIPILLNHVGCLSQLAVLCALYFFDKGIIKLLFFLTYFIFTMIMLVRDILIKDVFLKRSERDLEVFYDMNITNAYICTFLPSFVTLVVYYMMSKSKDSTLKNIIQSQKKIVDKIVEVEDEVEFAMAEKKDYGERKAKFKIDKNLFKLEYNDIRVVKKIGEGGSSSAVYLAEWCCIHVAFKCYKIKDYLDDEERYREFEKELTVLSSFSHPNILKFYGAALKEPRIGILMEYCENSDFRKFLIEYKKKELKNFSFVERLRILKECSLALIYIHDKNIIHRDVKTENVLISKMKEARIMDFGISRKDDGGISNKTSYVGTQFFMAPEVIKGGMYDRKCDIYSFSIMTFIVMTYEFDPYEKKSYKNGHHFMHLISNEPNYRPEFKDGCFSDLVTDDDIKHADIVADIKKLIVNCWEFQAKDRPSFLDIFQRFVSIMKKVESASTSVVKGEDQ